MRTVINQTADSKTGKNILLISNGHGEDIIGANLLRELLSEADGINVRVLPVVGRGQAYQSLPVTMAGPREILPSGGFMRNSLQNLWMDLKGGLLGLTLAQINYLRKIREEVDLVLVVGDIYILLLAGLFVRKAAVFLPTAKSEYIHGHYSVEKRLMKSYAAVVLPRDRKTSRVLQESGVNSLYLGNAMMDCFQIKGADFSLEPGARVIGILPGSREEAYQNILDILKVIEEIERVSGESYQYLPAAAGSLEVGRIKNSLKETKWAVQDPAQDNDSQGVSGLQLLLISPTGQSRIKIIYHHFGDILNQAELFIGLAGTANEQAVGMGKPVVAFPGRGSQYTAKFARDQQSLLGESLALVDRQPETAAGRVIEILQNVELYRRMSRAGRERMGKPGAVKKMVKLIKDFLP